MSRMFVPLSRSVNYEKGAEKNVEIDSQSWVGWCQPQTFRVCLAFQWPRELKFRSCSDVCLFRDCFEYISQHSTWTSADNRELYGHAWTHEYIYKFISFSLHSISSESVTKWWTLSDAKWICSIFAGIYILLFFFHIASTRYYPKTTSFSSLLLATLLRNV